MARARRAAAWAIIALTYGAVAGAVGASARGDYAAEEPARDVATGAALIGFVILAKWAAAELEGAPDA